MRTKKTRGQSEKLEFFRPDFRSLKKLGLYSYHIPAGFPSPAEDFLEKRLDLNDYLIRNQAATFLVKVTGTSMINAGISDGDILVVDRSVEPADGKIVLGVLQGEFTVKRIRKSEKKLYLMPENDKFKPIEVTEEMDFQIWGTVMYSIHKT
jgi:DNA polymerase V